MSVDDSQSLALQTQSIIGRSDEINTITWLLNPNTTDTDIVLLIGPGGIGKTRLLKEACVLAEDLHIVTTGIIDLYHTATHSNSGIERAIIDALDPRGIAFRNYRNLRKRFISMRLQVNNPQELEQLRTQLTKTFIDDFNQITAHQRVLLCIDTAEVVEFESDFIQSIGLVEDMAIEVREWLTDVLPQLINTGVLVAGRGARPDLPDDPRLRLWEAFSETFTEFQAQRTNFHWKAIPLRPFDEDEARDYVEGVAQVAAERAREARRVCDDRNAEFFDTAATNIRSAWEAEGKKIFQASEGRPIRLGLFIDLLTRLTDSLNTILDTDPVTWKAVAPKIVDGIENLRLSAAEGHPVGLVLEWLAATRQGLTPELLNHFIPEWSITQCGQILESVRSLSFVKTRPGTDQYFLHDEMYDILEEHMIARNRERFSERYQGLANYYDELLRNSKANDPRRTDWEICLLHYRLRVSPKQGYAYYATRSETSIKAHEVGFDMQLRDELLRFFDDPINRARVNRISRDLNRQAIDRDGAVRWIKRHIARGRYDRAQEVAEIVMYFGSPEMQALLPQAPATVAQLSEPIQQQARATFTVDNSLFWAQVLTHYGEALVMQGILDRAQEVLHRAINLLPTGEELHRDLEPETQEWWCARVLGWAHNLLSYAHRRARHYRRSLEHTIEARNYYRLVDVRNESDDDFIRAAGVKEELADTLNDGAYTYALLGDVKRAEMWISHALDIRKRLNQQYPLALSHNTQGLIYLLGDSLTHAERSSRTALQMAESLKEQRAQGLALQALGRIYGGMARSSVPGVSGDAETPEHLKKAQDCFKQALSIFRAYTYEQDRIPELYTDLGVVYRDEYSYYKAQGAAYTEEAQVAYQQAEDYLRQALELATDPTSLRHIDALEDLGTLYVRSNELKRAAEKYSEALNNVPAEYHWVKGGSQPKIGESVDTYWQILGKLHLGIATIYYSSIPIKEPLTDEQEAFLMQAVFHSTFAVAYFIKYSPEVTFHRVTFRQIYQSLKGYRYTRLMHVLDEVKKIGADYAIMEYVQPLLNDLDEMLGLREA